VRVFLDTNVLVSAFAARGLCSDLFELVLLDHELILSASVLRELSKALQQKVKLPPRDSAAIVAFLTDEAIEIVATSDPASADVDEDDAIVLGYALAGHAHVFITGDAKVLRLGQCAELRIASPRRFWEMLHT